MFIWILVLWMRGTVVSEAHSEPSHTSKMKLFARIAYCFQPLTISFKDLNLKCSTGFWIRLLVFNYFKTSQFYAENCISVRLSSCLNIYLLHLSKNFKEFTKNISIIHHQLGKKCNGLDVSTSCVVQRIYFN